MTAFYVREGSSFREAGANEIVGRAHALIAQRYRTGSPVMAEPQRAKSFLRLHLGALDHEVFGILHLDNRHRLIAIEDLFRGTVDLAPVYPREVVKSVIEHKSTAVILYHNHPSGRPHPSSADEEMTRRVKEALALIDVPVLDHLIVGEQIYSFAEHGMI